jgi:hypothetical protein
VVVAEYAMHLDHMQDDVLGEVYVEEHVAELLVVGIEVRLEDTVYISQTGHRSQRYPYLPARHGCRSGRALVHGRGGERSCAARCTRPPCHPSTITHTPACRECDKVLVELFCQVRPVLQHRKRLSNGKIGRRYNSS